MKKIFFTALIGILTCGNVTINEKMVMPVCNIVELKNDAELKNDNYNIDTELEDRKSVV